MTISGTKSRSSIKEPMVLPRNHRNQQTSKVDSKHSKQTHKPNKGDFLNKSITLFNKVFDSAEFNTIAPVVKIVNNTVSIAKKVFSQFTTEKPSTPTKEGISDHIKKISILSLITVPMTVYKFGKSIKDLIKAKTSDAFINASLVTANAASSLIEVPGKIANIIEMFTPITKVTSWGPYINIVSSILSIASLIITGRSYTSSRNLLADLKGKSNEAFIQELKKYLDAGEIDLNLIEGLDSKEIKNNMNKIAESIVNNSKNPAELKKFVKDIKSSIKNPSLLEKLEQAGNAAYINCLKKKDAAFLKKHFCVDGKKLKNRLNEISDIYKKKIQENNKPEEYIKKAVFNLKGRVKEKISSNQLSLLTSSIGMVTSGILLGGVFSPALSVVAPAGYALAIGLSAVGIAKLYDDRKQKEKFERAMGLN